MINDDPNRKKIKKKGNIIREERRERKKGKVQGKP